MPVIILACAVIVLSGCGNDSEFDAKAVVSTPELMTSQLILAGQINWDRMTETAVLTAITADYRNWGTFNKGPHYVPRNFAMLCTSVGQISEDGLGEDPHRNVEMDIYVNAKATNNPVGSYPVGAVVIKKQREQFSQEVHTNPFKSPKKLFGGMIKREPGYDPEHGDWFYFVDDGRGMKSGKLPACVKCHAGTAATDYVFRRWD